MLLLNRWINIYMMKKFNESVLPFFWFLYVIGTIILLIGVAVHFSIRFDSNKIHTSTRYQALNNFIDWFFCTKK